MMVEIKQSTIKNFIKSALIFLCVLILGIVALAFYFMSDKEIKYKEESKKDVGLENSD